MEVHVHLKNAFQAELETEGSGLVTLFGLPPTPQARSYGAILKLIFRGRYALPKGHVSRLRCSFRVNL